MHSNKEELSQTTPKKYTILNFSIRTDANLPLSKMRSLVDHALGIKLIEGDFHGTPVLMTEVFGMNILLGLWKGLKGIPTFQLHGFVDDVRFLNRQDDVLDVTPVIIDIGQAIIDLLIARGGGDWRLPSIDETRAETEYREEIDRDFQTPESGPKFEPDEDE